MGAAQITRTTSGMQISGGLSLYESRFATLYAHFQPLSPILASDMNELVALLSLWATHTHSVADLRGRDTFGNKATYGAAGTEVQAVSTGVPGAASNSFLSVLAGQTVNVTIHNTLRSALENFRAGHTHSILDTTS